MACLEASGRNIAVINFKKPLRKKNYQVNKTTFLEASFQA
jgi:hypothetical protein